VVAGWGSAYERERGAGARLKEWKEDCEIEEEEEEEEEGE